jgi:hypothetical protein
VPNDRVPVGRVDGGAPPGTEDPGQLFEGGVERVDVLDDLDADRGVEAVVGER